MRPMKGAKKTDTHVGDDEKEEEEFFIQTNHPPRTSAWTQYILFLGVGHHIFFFFFLKTNLKMGGKKVSRIGIHLLLRTSRRLHDEGVGSG